MSLADPLSRSEVLAVECPLCAAKRGKPCHAIGSDREVDLHHLRRDAAWAKRIRKAEKRQRRAS